MAMGSMLQRAENILESNSFTALYDKGYHTGSELKKAFELGIDVMVAIPSVAANAPNPEYNVEKFTFDKTNDCYICPQDKILKTNGRCGTGPKLTFLNDIQPPPAKHVRQSRNVQKQNTEKQSNGASSRNWWT